MQAETSLSPPSVTATPIPGYQQSGSLLRIYHYYRLGVGIALVLLQVLNIGEGLLGRINPTAFAIVSILYAGLNGLIALLSYVSSNDVLARRSSTYTIVCLDALTLTALLYCSGGVTSGLGALVIVSIAAAAILITGRLSFTLPAIASIAVLYGEIYLSLTGHPAEFFQAGILGTLFFITTGFISYLAARLRTAEALSATNAMQAASLQQLSELVIQRMHTGILVISPERQIKMMNQSARRLLGLDDDIGATPLFGPLLTQLESWRAQPDTRVEAFQPAPTGPEIRASFSSLNTGVDTDSLIFLEDNTDLQQQAQQLKLAALGRLSASIAHEIRNPLGAISHAAQLLSESEDLNRPDARLAEIVQSHSRRVNTIIENVLELSRRREPQPTRFPLQSWLTEFVVDFEDSLGQPADLSLTIERPNIEVRFDPGQLRQVLTNLTNNGLRYSARQTGTPSIHYVGGVDLFSERPFLDVIDSGPGVPAHKLGDLFEPFFTTETEGTGLGLYLSRELCEANQARLSYLPAETGGACFRITFSHQGTREQPAKRAEA